MCLSQKGEFIGLTPRLLVLLLIKYVIKQEELVPADFSYFMPRSIFDLHILYLLPCDVIGGCFKSIFYAKVHIRPPRNYLLYKSQQNIGFIHCTEEGFNC